MLSLDLEWLAPVSLLRSDRWLAFYMQPGLPATPEKMRQIGENAIADLQYYQSQSQRMDDRIAALQRCFLPDRPDCHNLDFLQRIATQLLTWRGNAFEVQEKYLSLWAAIIAKVDPVWILAAAYTSLLEKGTLTPTQIALIGATQCPAAIPRDHKGKIFADNHVHLNGHGSSNLALLDFSALLSKMPKKNKVRWPPQPEFTIYASGTRDPSELPLLVNGLFHYLARSLFSLEANDPDKANHSTFPDWHTPVLWQPVKTGTATLINLRELNLPAQQLMYAALHGDHGVDQRWLLLATALVMHDRNDNNTNIQRYALRAYIHACNIFRASMIMAGTGLTEFVQHFGFSWRKRDSDIQGYGDYAFTSDSAAHVLREFKVGTNMVNRRPLEKHARALITHKRQDNCQFVFHFSRAAKADCRTDRYQRHERFKIRCETRRLQKELNAVGNQEATIALSPHAQTTPVNLTQLVRGIDVAGNENHLQIEIFAPAIRVLRATRCGNPSDLFQPSRQMHLSIHAGEDYSHLISGLRAIDETVVFCDYRAGDRIGHGLALGVDANTWLARQGRIYLPLQEYVDNLVWCHMRALEIIQEAPQFHGVIHILEQKINQWAAKVYNRQPNIAALKKAWQLRRNCPATSRFQSHAYGTEWELWVPDMRFLNEEKDDESITLWQHYLRPPAQTTTQQNPVAMISLADKEHHSLACHDSSQYSEIITPLELDLITAIQDLLIERYSRLGVIIEACPSSNVYVGRLNDYHEHPIFRWYPPCMEDLNPGEKANRHGLRKGPLRVCVNTDDAGLMPTTIEHEHRLLKDAAIARHRISGDHAEKWIDRIREIGVEEFKANHLDWHNSLGFLKAEAAEGKRADFEQYLNLVPDTPAPAGDELP